MSQSHLVTLKSCRNKTARMMPVKKIVSEKAEHRSHVGLVLLTFSNFLGG